jgi:D-alanine-D-alanine ligase
VSNAPTPPLSKHPNRLRVAILYGGRSAEHEISLLSARFVLESLDRSRFQPLLVAIDKQGVFRVQDERHLLEAPADPRAVALDLREPEVVLLAQPKRGGASLARLGVESGALDEGRGPAIDVVFPVLHGPYGEDGTVQGLLELANLPYVGAGVLGSAVGMDKDVMKRLLLAAGLPVLPYRTLRATAFARAPEAELAACAALGFPSFVKPSNLGSSVGVSRVLAAAELRAAVEHAFEFDEKVVVEQGLDHPREIECAVLGGDEPFASVPGEIEVAHADGFYSYRAKYLDGDGAVTRIPAKVTDAQRVEAQRLALATFAALDGAGMARVDLFLAADGRWWVNEINTIPGFTRISMFPKLMEASGIPAPELMARLIDDALTRAARKRSLRTNA